VLANLNYTAVTDSKVFRVQQLGVGHDFEIVRPELTWFDRHSVTVEELNGHTLTMFGEESNSLCSCLDGVEHVPDGGSFLDEIGLLELSKFVVLQIFSGCNELFKL
jgi:hypothetical protein